MTLDADDFNARVEARWLQMQLRCLAANLAAAGALCEAFSQGWDEREHHDLYGKYGFRTDAAWSPGCNLSTRGK